MEAPAGTAQRTKIQAQMALFLSLGLSSAIQSISYRLQQSDCPQSRHTLDTTTHSPTFRLLSSSRTRRPVLRLV